MKNIHLLGKKVVWEKCPLLVDYTPDENWRELWLPKTGEWTVDLSVRKRETWAVFCSTRNISRKTSC